MILPTFYTELLILEATCFHWGCIPSLHLEISYRPLKLPLRCVLILLITSKVIVKLTIQQLKIISSINLYVSIYYYIVPIYYLLLYIFPHYQKYYNTNCDSKNWQNIS